MPATLSSPVSLIPHSRRSIFLLPVVSPYNLAAVLWQLTILLLDLVYTAFWVPMNVRGAGRAGGRAS